MKREINALLLIGIIGTAVAGSQFAVNYGRATWGDKDIWWTPASLALPLEDTKHQFRIFLSGEPLQNHLEEGSLSATDSSGQSYRVVAEDLRVRLNNWNKVKASHLHSAVLSAFMLGVSLTCLFLGVLQSVTSRKKAPKQDSDPPGRSQP